ncbi:DUF4913 domain-containing protein [Streptomyces sp. AC495_CC817]|uniref:DUF4913 domain-containing protein n=1 Tax=Streptomyces sp. AC495_CC817 TaxID=2823900 RepID=UPI001C25F767|nr:DUF4913 domain-containing protein [Streptomyces sp. AC495_CC817]
MTGTEAASGEPEFYFADVEAFVSGYLSPVIRRRIDGSSATWCPQWWQHPEASARLTALWLAWEHLRKEPGPGMSTWWLYHVDPHLRVLMDVDAGPFAACSPEDGHTAQPFAPLPLDTMPVPEAGPALPSLGRPSPLPPPPPFRTAT